MFLLLLFAIIAGIITSLSPCILPVLPLLLAAGTGPGRYRPYAIIIGLIVSFSFFTLFLTSIIHAFGISPNTLRFVAIIFFVLFGLTLLFPRFELLFTKLVSPLVQFGSRAQLSTQGTGFISGLFFGVALGLVWAPCAGPILAAITTLAATGEVTGQAIAVTVAYSIGTALPMFFIIQGGVWLVGTISPYSQWIRKIFGLFLICSALAIALHVDMLVQQLTANYFPSVGVEDIPIVQKELEALKNEVGMTTQAPIIGGKAPDFVGIHTWINSAPLTMHELKGKVVLVDFWTYSCINCIRTLPYLKSWYNDYKDLGFVIVGVHTPEFAFEHQVKNVEDAAKRLGITYPIAIDNEYATWRNYANQYWPAHYLIDQQGIIREIHFGEGHYQHTENMIRSLLGLAATKEEEKKGPLFTLQTPEIYLGYQRARNYPWSITLQHDVAKKYAFSGHLDEDQVSLNGMWRVSAEAITSQDKSAQLQLNFHAQRVYVVMTAQEPAKITVLLDGKGVPASYRAKDMDEQSQITVRESKMYALINLEEPGRHLLTLEVPAEVSLYAFTFGAINDEPQLK